MNKKPTDDDLIEALNGMGVPDGVDNGDYVLDLLARGANPNARHKDSSPVLMDAVNHWTPELVNILLNGGADGKAADERGETVLMEAAGAGDEENIQLLLKAGAVVDAQSLDGMTALMRAAEYDRLDCVNALLVAGADHALVNNEGQTAEDLAGDKTKPILTALRENELLQQVPGDEDKVQDDEPRRKM
jgi:ankyrin repeat protein